MDKKSSNPAQGGFDLSETNKSIEEDVKSRYVSEEHRNTTSDEIIITHDKLENILLKHLHKLEKAKSWLTPLSMFLTVLLTLLTTEFKDFIGISKDIWKALFLLLLVFSCAWLCYSFYERYKFRKELSIESLIEKIKNRSQ